MRCKACDKNLTDFEATRKYSSTGEFVDLCNGCYRYVKGPAVDERPELQSEWEVDNELE